MSRSCCKKGEKIRIVVDVVQRRPACVLLQAVMGGDSSYVGDFPVESWLLDPTDDMRVVAGTRAEWESFRAELRRRFPLTTRCRIKV